MRHLILILILFCSANAQRFVKSVANVNQLIALQPNDVNTNVFVAGYYTSNDGGAGTFQWKSTGIGSTNMGTIFASSVLTSGRWERIYTGAIYASWFGADGTGITDSTTAIKSAYDVLVNQRGGTLVFDKSKYKFNITITNDNIILQGMRQNGTRDTNLFFTSFIPADFTKPVIQVGNDTDNVWGFSLRDTIINATGCPGAVYLFAGPIESSFDNCSFYNGADTVKIQGGTNFPSTLINFKACNFWEGTNSTIYLLRPTNVLGYVTGIYLDGCHINGNNNTGYAVRLDRAILSSVNTYYDLQDNRAVWIKNGGKFRGQNVELEATPNGFGLITISDESAHDPSRFLQGAISALGTIVYQDATTDTIPALLDFTSKGYIQTPFIKGPIYIVAQELPFGTNNIIEALSSTGPLSLKSWLSDISISPGIKLYATNGVQYGLIEASATNGGLFIGAYGTNLDVRIQSVNGGSVRFLSASVANEDVDGLKRIYVWGGNGSRAGFLDAASVGGGLELAASGVNQNVRVDPTGTGFLDVKAPISIQNSSFIYSGTGSPEGVITAPPGSLFMNKTGGAGVSIYVKESGIGNVGWIAK